MLTPKENIFLIKNILLAAQGFHYCVGAFSSCGEWGLLFVAVCGLFIVVASRCGAQPLGMWASTVAARHLSSCGCPKACGIFLDQRSNPCPPHWQADSEPLDHQGSPLIEI